MASITPAQARALWREVETVHAVTYFAAESRDAATEVGLRGFWMGYFGFRAAPLGAVGPGLVQATFANFAPDMIERAVPDAWSYAKPADLVYARSASAAMALRNMSDTVAADATEVNATLADVVRAADPTGRPLFAANQSIAGRSDPVASLWQWCTSIREHRGDGHVAAFVAAGLSGLDAHLLQVGAGVVPAQGLREARGWSETAWNEAADGLVARGLLDAAGVLTDAGHSVKGAIEDTTDRLAATIWSTAAHDAVLSALTRVADDVRAASLIPVPNPIGLT